MSQYLQIHLNRTFLSAITIQERKLFATRWYLCAVYILEVLLNFIIKSSVSRQKHVKDYLWVKSQVNPPLGHISVTFMWCAHVKRTYSFISIPLDICCWHKIDVAHSLCCPHTLHLCIDLPHNGFQATRDFFLMPKFFTNGKQ